MNRAEQMKNLKTGNGIRQLLDEGYKILGNPLKMFDTDYKKIAHTDMWLDDPFWIELTTTGTYSMQSQIFFMNEYFTDGVANAEKLSLMVSDKLNYDRILGHIYNGNGIKVANIMMLEYREPFDSDMIAAFEILADLFTEEFREDKFYIEYGEAYQNAWINKLIDDNIEEKRLYSPHVQILYNGFKTNLYVAAVDISRRNAPDNDQKYFVDYFRSVRNDFKYAVYGEHVVIVMSSERKKFDIKKELGELVECFERENLFAGVSNSFDNLFELRKYYNEAVQAINIPNSNGGPHVFLYSHPNV